VSQNNSQKSTQKNKKTIYLQVVQVERKKKQKSAGEATVSKKVKQSTQKNKNTIYLQVFYQKRRKKQKQKINSEAAVMPTTTVKQSNQRR